MPSTELPTHFFATQAEWHAWLDKHHADTPGIWLRMYKKDSGVKTITYAEALDEALCYGWIEGQLKKDDIVESWLQRFTSRRPKGNWSIRNTNHVERLIKEGRMQPAGLREVEAAKQDGRWAAAYAGQSASEVPEDFLAEIKKHPKALAFFKTLSKANTFAIYYQLQTAKKPETREKRKQKLLEMLKNGQVLH